MALIIKGVTVAGIAIAARRGLAETLVLLLLAGVPWLIVCLVHA